MRICISIPFAMSTTLYAAPLENPRSFVTFASAIFFDDIFPFRELSSEEREEIDIEEMIRIMKTAKKKKRENTRRDTS